MGGTTNLFCNIHFDKETFEFKSDVINKLNETNKLIGTNELNIHNLAIMTEPNKVFNSNADLFYVIKTEVEDILENLKNLYIKRYKLELLLNNWDNNIAITPPENID